MLGRLLHGFQQGVEGLRGKHVDLVDDIHFIAADRGQIGNLVAQIADVINTVVGGCVHLDNIHDGTGVDALADFALAAWVRAGMVQTVDRFGKNFCACGFARAAGAGKKVSVADAPGGDLVLQSCYDRSLADDIRKTLRTPLAVQCAVHQSHLPAKTVKRRAEHAAALLGVQMQACRGTVQTLLNAARFPA